MNDDERKLAKLGQALLAGQEELQRRRFLIYWWKNLFNRKFGLFKEWGDQIKQEYKNKYPLLYE